MATYEQQRRLADILRSQSMSPMQVDPRGPVSWTQGLEKLAQGYFARQADKRATEGEQRQEKLRSVELDQFMRALRGERAASPMMPGVMPSFRTPEVQGLAAQAAISDAERQKKLADAMALQRAAPPEAYTLSPGQSRFVGGQQVASMPATPTPAPQRAAATDIGRLSQDLTGGIITQEMYDQEVDAMQQERAAAQAAVEAKQAEQANREQLMNMETRRILDLTDRLIANEEGLRGATGPISSRIPSVRQETLDFESDLQELQSLLTMTNLGRMTGVLSESDIRLIANAASGINEGGSEQRMRSKIREIRERILPKVNALNQGAAPAGQQPVVAPQELLDVDEILRKAGMFP